MKVHSESTFNRNPKVSSLPNHIKTDYTSLLCTGMCGSEEDTHGHVHATHTHTLSFSMHACVPMMTSPLVSDKHRKKERESAYPYHIGGGTPSEQQ